MVDRAEAPKPLEDLTYKVIGCAMRVHNKLGAGLKEAGEISAANLATDSGTD